MLGLRLAHFVVDMTTSRNREYIRIDVDWQPKPWYGVFMSMWWIAVGLVGFTGCYDVESVPVDAGATCTSIHQFVDGSVDAEVFDSRGAVDNSHACAYNDAELPLIECGSAGCVIIDKCASKDE